MTSSEVAARLGCSQRTVARMAERGQLTPTEALPGKGGIRLFDPADVDRMANERLAEHQSVISAIRAAAEVSK